ncbi:MAG: ABC-F family ATP-binding cassette domain-containing protein [Oscillochloris sp.]|nr:ABC-F family ATP-binding cassette domain-containing protein [Oscillochloris sp.]
MSLMQVHNLTKYFGAARIFSGVSFQIAPGDRVGLIGVNGAGKSTLLKIIAGVEPVDRGGVQIKRGTRLAYVAQEARPDPEHSLREEMIAARPDLIELQAELRLLEAAIADTADPDWQTRMDRYAECLERFELAGGYDLDRRIEQILQGLGFSAELIDAPAGPLSGGQKTRLTLGTALLAEPDLLLLDEPTNHLDLGAVEWLETFLSRWNGTLIVISHDRYFLDQVTNRTIDMAHGTLAGDYPAPYNRAMRLKAEREALQLKQYEAQQEQIARTEEYIQRYKAGSRAGQARGRERRLNRLKDGWERIDGTVEQLIDPPKQQRALQITLAGPARSDSEVLHLEQLQVGYAEPLIGIEKLAMQRGERVAILGANGSGKTTFLRTLVGELPALGGTIQLGRHVRVGYYSQGHEQLRRDSTVLAELQRADPAAPEGALRTLAGRFLFSGDDVFKQVSDLSGGERSRLALACLTMQQIELLMLDEPTNHLDIGARHALEAVLQEFAGALLFVSHDRAFVDTVADTIWEVRDREVIVHYGGYQAFSAARAA